MLVYGDPQTRVAAAELIRELEERFAAASDLESTRLLLIRAGQLEQGIADAGETHQVRELAEAITDDAAQRFVGFWLDGRSALPQEEPAELRSIAPLLGDRELLIKVPEGYAFYALIPDQYCAAAREWHASHAAARHVAVIGIRSIGTSLSAAVAEVLLQLGCSVRRTSVRPGGHPFRRTVEIRPNFVPGADAALIVDEGPGLSGSSFASVARALIDQGYPAERISFFPGHRGEPGNAALPEVRHLWETTERVIVEFDHVSHLSGGKPAQAQDLGGGNWRSLRFPEAVTQPPINTALERAKFLIRSEDGRVLLWKWEGLHDRGAAYAFAEQARRAAAGWCLPPVSMSGGFVAMEWQEGCRTPDLSPRMLDHLQSYVKAVAGAPLSADETAAAFARLREMIIANVREALGETQANLAERLCNRTNVLSGLPRYGDGRMAPHEWLLTSEGKVLKTDATGHDTDHTIIGPQPFLWDVAGAIVEWQLTPADRQPFLRNTNASEDLLHFYELAYVAWKLGYHTQAGNDQAVAEARERLGKLCHPEPAKDLSLFPGVSDTRSHAEVQPL